MKIVWIVQVPDKNAKGTQKWMACFHRLLDKLLEDGQVSFTQNSMDVTFEDTLGLNVNEEQANDRFPRPTVEELYGNEAEEEFGKDYLYPIEAQSKTELAIEMCKKFKQPFTIIKKRLGGKK